MKGKTAKKIIFFLVILIAVVIVFQRLDDKEHNLDITKSIELKVEDNQTGEKQIPVTSPVGNRLPKLIDIGSGTCVPCKMMKPIIDDLQKNYNSFFETEYIDLNYDENREKAYYYQVRVIPTILFFDADGQQLYRHEGYISKEDILKNWKKFNVKVE